MSTTTSVFAPYRALGFVCGEVRTSLQRLGDQNFVSVAVGRSWNVYNCEKLRLVFAGGQLDDDVSCIVSGGREVVYVVTRSQIHVYNRLEHLRTLSGHSGRITALLNFGRYLLSAGEDHQLIVWDGITGKLTRRLALREDAHVTTLLHPSSYMNKVLLGFSDGTLQLWNTRTGKLIHTFSKFSSRITCLCDSPAIDVVAVGLADGGIVLHNIRHDRPIVRFQQSDGEVTGLSFRTDDVPVLASSSAQGHVALWNLETKRIQTLMRLAHDDRIVSLDFLQSEPILLTASSDNSMKMWIFDLPDGTGRLLRSRSGHRAAPSRVRFYGDRGTSLLSTGQDRALRHFSLIRDEQNVELSQGNLNKTAKRRQVSVEDLRLPVVTDFDASAAKERQWSNIVTCHQGSSVARIWKFEQKVLTKTELGVGSHARGSTVCAVSMSACGNFAVLGYEDGAIDRYNMQSGIFRGTYGDSDTSHDSAVVGLQIDGLNRTMVSSSSDSTLKFWDFAKFKLVHTEELPSPVTQILLHRDSELLAVACADLTVLMYDINTHRLVRRFSGHENRITDMTFTADGRWLLTSSLHCGIRVFDVPSGCLVDYKGTFTADGRWLLTSSLDCGIRVFDVPSGRLVEWMRFDRPPTSLSFSPREDFLVTTHVDSVGIFLWVNRAFFSNVYLKSLSSADRPSSVITLPSTSQPEFLSKTQSSSQGIHSPLSLEDIEHEASIRAFEDDDESDSENDEGSSGSDTADGSESNSEQKDDMADVEEETPGDDLKPLGPDLVTLSTLPASMWQTLSQFDLIKERNKPKQPVKKPKAPFFLPTVGGVEGTSFDTTAGPSSLPSFDAPEPSSPDERPSLFDELKDDFATPLPSASGKASSSSTSRISRSGEYHFDASPLVRLLRSSAESATYSPVTQYLKSLSPAAIDAELRTLGMDPDTEQEELMLAAEYFTHELGSHQNFELLQAYLNVFLQVHSTTIFKSPILLERVRSLQRMHRKSYEHLDELVQKTLCLVAHFSGLR